MKQFNIFSKCVSRSLVAVAALFVALSLSSCLKDGEEGPETVAAAQAINAVPGSEGLIVALDNNQLNNLAAGEGFAYEDIMRYRRVYPGNRLLRVFHPQDVASNEEILRTNVEFEIGEYYSLFVVGTADEDMEVLLVADSLKAPETGTAMIRFINLSPDAPALVLGIEGRDALLANGTAFKAHTAYTQVDAGEGYRFFIRPAGTDASENVYEFEFTPKDKFIYTICAKGFFDGEDPEAETAFGHGVIEH